MQIDITFFTFVLKKYRYRSWSQCGVRSYCCFIETILLQCHCELFSAVMWCCWWLSHVIWSHDTQEQLTVPAAKMISQDLVLKGSVVDSTW